MLFKRTLRYIWAHAALQINSMLHVFGLQYWERLYGPEEARDNHDQSWKDGKGHKEN